MELRQLRYFLTAAEELHLGRAAARMHITQPAFSQQIHRLERELGVRLLKITSHKISLTPAGSAFLDQAQATLSQATEAADTARRAGRGEIGTLSIAFVVGAAQRVLPAALRILRERYPGITPVLNEMWSAQQLEALRRERLHVGFVLGAVPDPKLRSQRVYRESFVALLPEQHALAALAEVPFAALAAEPFVLFRRELNPGLHDRLTSMGRDACGQLNVRYEVEHPGAIQVLVAAGHAVTITSSSRADQFAEAGLVARPLVDPTPQEDITMVWRSDETSALVTNFLGAVTRS